MKFEVKIKAGEEISEHFVEVAAEQGTWEAQVK
jgi:hypothetical protein